MFFIVLFSYSIINSIKESTIEITLIYFVLQNESLSNYLIRDEVGTNAWIALSFSALLSPLASFDSLIYLFHASI